MNGSALCRFLGEHLPPSFECRLAPQGAVQVCTPLLYPDGGLVDVYVQKLEDEYQVTDFGEAWVQLQDQTLCEGLTSDQRRESEEVCQAWGATLHNVEIRLHCPEATALCEAVQHLAHAAAQAAEIWLKSIGYPAAIAAAARSEGMPLAK